MRPHRFGALILVAGLVLASACGTEERLGDETAGVPVAPGSCTAATNRPTGTPGHPFLGVSLDWDYDSVAAYSYRLGTSPAVYVTFAPFPLDQGAKDALDDAVDQVRPTGGLVLLTLEPNDGLEVVTQDTADDLANVLRRVNGRGVEVIVRFAHEMNGSWYAWSQRPGQYVDAFRVVADAIHASAPGSATMWAPNYGGGYPFSGGRFEALPGSPDAAELDTDGDGSLTMGDDPYAPYYPGDDAVDWVGMSLYHWGSAYPWGENEVPEPGKFEQLLTGTYVGANGDESAVPDFYDAMAVGHDKPLAITETAALWAPDQPGDELAVKQAWWSQVFAPDVARRFPLLEMINWFEWDKHEPETGDRVDWTATRSTAIAQWYSSALPDWLTTAPGACD